MKKKNIIFISITLIAIFIYILTLALIITYKPSYEYSMYYKQRLVKYWSGDNAMTISTDYKMEFDYNNNPKDLNQNEVKDVHLQFLDKNFEFKTYNNDGAQLEYIYTKDGALYWQWNNDTNFDKINIEIKVCCNDKFTIKANSQIQSEYSSTNLNFESIIYCLEYSKQNKLECFSTSEIQIKQLLFLEI